MKVGLLFLLGGAAYELRALAPRTGAPGDQGAWGLRLLGPTAAAALYAVLETETSVPICLLGKLFAELGGLGRKT